MTDKDNKLQSLTPEQEAQMPVYMKKWTDIGLATQTSPVDVEKVTEILGRAYAAGDLKAPDQVMIFKSPRELVFAHNILEKGDLKALQQVYTDLEGASDRKTVWKKAMDGLSISGKLEVPNFIWGQHDAFLSYYDYFMNETDVKGLEPIRPLIELASHINWAVPYTELCIISEKPTECHLSSTGRLHNGSGAALKYGDGYSIYSLNGVNMYGLERFIDETDKIKPKEVLDIVNVEQRAELIKLIGIENLFNELKPELMDSQNDYELYKIPLYEDSPRIYLKMKNPSVDEIHLEAVHPECTSVSQALHWRNFGDTNLPTTGFEQPIILT